MTVKIHLESAGSVVSAEGDAEFVKGVVDTWKHLLSAPSKPLTAESVGEKRGSSQASKPTTPEEDFDNVYASHNGRLKIIANMPGNSKAELTRNTALALLYGEYRRGVEEVSAEAIKDACLDQGCYDNKNFASHLKSLKPRVVMDPKPGGDYTIKLTAPGRKFAKEFVEQLNS